MQICIGFVAGAAAAMLVSRRIVRPRVLALRDENRTLRDALRYVQRTTRRRPELLHLTLYLDAVLAEDQGA